MSRLAIHHQAALARTHAEIAAAVTSLHPEQPVSIRSVRRILKEPVPSLQELSADARTSSASGPGRPSVAEPLREQVATALETEPHLFTSELLRRARDLWGYQGEKTAFYELVKSIRKPEGLGAEPIVRFEGVAGEYAQFDFGDQVQNEVGLAAVPSSMNRRQLVRINGREQELLNIFGFALAMHHAPEPALPLSARHAQGIAGRSTAHHR
jgi:hypothetical protein